MKHTFRKIYLTNRIKPFLLYWLPVLVIMGIIFYSSSQTYHEQDIRPWINEKLPHEFIKEHFSNTKIIYDGKEISIRTKGVAGFVEFIIRKAAHVAVFAGLSFFLIRALWKTTTIHRGLMTLVTLVFSILYACSDELHQSFTGDRTPALADIMIDTFGILIGIISYLLIVLILRKITDRGV